MPMLSQSFLLSFAVRLARSGILLPIVVYLGSVGIAYPADGEQSHAGAAPRTYVSEAAAN